MISIWLYRFSKFRLSQAPRRISKSHKEMWKKEAFLTRARGRSLRARGTSRGERDANDLPASWRNPLGGVAKRRAMKRGWGEEIRQDRLTPSPLKSYW